MVSNGLSDDILLKIMLPIALTHCLFIILKLLVERKLALRGKLPFVCQISVCKAPKNEDELSKFLEEIIGVEFSYV